MKSLVRRCFDPAIHFLNRYSFPRKFAIAGTLVVLPLFFVTCQYLEILNERVELSQQELAGNQTIRALTPLWRTLCEARLAAVVAGAHGHPLPDGEIADLRGRLRQQLDDIATADHLQILQHSTRWIVFLARLQDVLSTEPVDRPSLSEPALLSGLIDDVHTIRRHVADLSKLSVDPQLDSQNLAVSISKLIPDLVDMEDRLRDKIAKAGIEMSQDRFDLELAEFHGGLNVLFDRVQQNLGLSSQLNPDEALRLRGVLSVGQESMRQIESGIRQRQFQSEEAPSLGEIDSRAAASIRDTLSLLEASQDAFEDVVETRTERARTWKLCLLVAALAPLTLAGYLVVGLCLAIIQTADQMRDVTDCLLSENGSDRVKVTVEAQDELGRMIEHFGRLTVRLREELLLAQAEALRASAAEESLRVNQQRFDLVLRGANDGIWDWDLQTDRVFYSDRFQELLGYQQGELNVWLSALADILHPDDFDITWRAVERHFQDREPYHIEHRLKTSSGEYRWFLERGQAVWDDNGAPIRMAGSIKDITVRKRMEEDSREYLREVEATRDRITEQSVQLIQQSEELARARDQAEAAARAKSDFLANMSHELRTPLTAILGYADLLYEEGCDGDAPPRPETVEIIRSNGRHLLELIDDILDLSKIDAGHMTLELAGVSPRQLVEDVLRLMQLRAREKGLSLQADYCFPLPDLITTDALRVRQILVNLVGNAIKFTERGEIRVTVRYEAATRRQIFAVADCGIGIRPEQLQRLFAPFTQADATMSRRFGGTGLGLSISKRLAQMLGGDITVMSTHGSGSIFTLEISAEMSPGATMLNCEPVLNREPAKDAIVAARPSTEPAPRLTGRILLAEDVPANQKLIAFLLQKWGAEIHVVDNGTLAVVAALHAMNAELPFDLILMDIQMPEMDGYAATAALRSQGYSGRIIALTAHASDEDRDRCLASGFDGFAVKPIQKDQLYATCRDQLEASRQVSTPAVT